jgi:hypothetical protein
MNFRRELLVRVALMSVLGIAVAIGTVQFVVHTRSTSDQLRYRVDLAGSLSDVAYNQFKRVFAGEDSRASSQTSDLADVPTSEIIESSDARIPSASLRMQFMWESLDSVREHLYGLYGEGIGQAQALREERITHLVYLLLLEEGGWPLLLAYLALLFSLYRNLWRSDEAVEYRLCLAAALTSLVLGGLFQTHMYARFYWIPLFFAFATSKRHEDAQEEGSLDSSYAVA